MLVLTTWMLCFSSLTSAQTNNLCELPEGNFTKKGVTVFDKSSGTRERYDFELTVKKGSNPAGKVTVSDITLKGDGSLETDHRGDYLFSLSGCTPSQPVFTVDGIYSDLVGYIKVHNINHALEEITVSGGIHTYSEGLAGWTEWLADKFGDVIGYEGTVEIDFRQLPFRLKK
ncbi:hypothetical protein ACH42_10935 [Endozoicomonas sp. (ex Bugula neritina AB1)]|nr:hypothetical protein ACH42_10935 [Endozoicomonas sp. (ex Bugula neritina AB1)]